jgi:hypothetical protein
MTGNATGGSLAPAVLVSGGAAEISGVVRGGSGNSVNGLLVTGGAATVRGSVYPGTFASGSTAISSAGTVRVSGDVYSGGMAASTGPNGFFPIAGSWTVIDGEDIFVHVYNDDNYPSGNNGSQTVLTRYGTSNPAIEDVRAGVIYGVADQLEGTLAVPPAASVAAGVPTDDTVGTAALGLADVLAGTGAQIAAATSG